MDNKNITKYFNKIYVSSVYGEIKKDGKFFDYPIQELDLPKDEILFVDDDIVNLNVSKEKGFIPILMNRDNIEINSEYRSISSLFEI